MAKKCIDISNWKGPVKLKKYNGTLPALPKEVRR